VRLGGCHLGAFSGSTTFMPNFDRQVVGQVSCARRLRFLLFAVRFALYCSCSSGLRLAWTHVRILAVYCVVGSDVTVMTKFIKPFHCHLCVCVLDHTFPSSLGEIMKSRFPCLFGTFEVTTSKSSLTDSVGFSRIYLSVDVQLKMLNCSSCAGIFLFRPKDVFHLNPRSGFLNIIIVIAIGNYIFRSVRILYVPAGRM